MKARRIIVRLLALIILIGIAVTMFIIGRGHTLYFDNKTIDYDGTTYSAMYQIDIYVGDDKVASLKDGDRGMVTTMGQDFSMVIHFTKEKGGKKVGGPVSLKIPYSMDGIIYNLPAMIGGAPEEAYMEEFIPTTVEEDDTEDFVGGDEFDMSAEG